MVAGVVLDNYLHFADVAYQGNNSPAYTSTGSSTGTLAVTEGASTTNVVCWAAILQAPSWRQAMDMAARL
jgi:tetrahydromethanopterin S-methyltransferase subunit D